MFVGWGAIGRATLVPLAKLVKLDFSRIIIIDALPREHEYPRLAALGVQFVHSNITEENYNAILSKYLAEGDIFVDVAININSCEMLEWCATRKVLFFNTAVYEWDHCGTKFDDFSAYTPLFDETLEEMRKVREINERFDRSSATAVLSHGANPGLVNHLMKKGIEEIAKAVIDEKPNDPRVPALVDFLEKRNHAKLAQLLTIRVIQVSERDTQKVSSYKPKDDEYISTWNIPSFCEELAAPAEFSWGTHEINAPEGSKYYGEKPGEKSFVSFPTRGHQTWARSWMPVENEFCGMVVRHEECFSMANYVSVRDEITGELKYRPSVYFVYDQNLSAESIRKFVENDYELLPRNSVVEKEIDSGADKLGVLLLGHDFGAWWIGSHLDIHEARRLCSFMEDCVGSVGATALQVGVTLAASIYWGMLNPFSGAHFPESLPTDFILNVAIPWLGTFVSQRHNWTPSTLQLTEQSESERADEETATEEEGDESDSDSSTEGKESESPLEQKTIARVADHKSTLVSAVIPVSTWEFSNFLCESPVGV